MRTWAYLLGGLLIWAAHFFILYGAASIFLTSGTTRLITLVATILCFAGALWLAWSAGRRGTTGEDRFRHWSDRIAALGGALACIAVLWQGLPALLI